MKHILIGTHALIEDRVKFNDLEYDHCDEQHRFGVEQRAKLWMQQQPSCAGDDNTPFHLYGGDFGDRLDVSVIDELPCRKKANKTIHLFESSRLRVYWFMKRQIKLGQQIYIVFP